MKDAVQGALLTLSAAGAWFVTEPMMRQRRIGYLLGLLSQPFWLWATYTADQWGMFVLACWYTVVWSRGVYRGWKPL